MSLPVSSPRTDKRLHKHKQDEALYSEQCYHTQGPHCSSTALETRNEGFVVQEGERLGWMYITDKVSKELEKKERKERP